MDVRLHSSNPFTLWCKLSMCLSMYFSFKLSRSFCKSVWDTFGYGEGIEGSPLLSKDRVLGVSLHVDKLITFLIGEEAAGGYYGVSGVTRNSVARKNCHGRSHLEARVY